MSSFRPNPIDTSDVTLSEELLSLTEELAENTHNLWAAERIRKGWVYGEKRDDAAKTTPCLVPYDELSDSEKAYDMTTSMETIKLIVKLGYKIKKGIRCRERVYGFSGLCRQIGGQARRLRLGTREVYKPC